MNQTLESSGVKSDTKERILDAAEKLFADNGFPATSLRQITSAAGANLAAVNYYFHSKEALAWAVLMRRLEPINDERLRRLAEVEASTSGPLPLEAVVDCLIRPVFDVRRRRELSQFPRFMARLLLEPGDWVDRLMRQSLGPLMLRFMDAFRRASPEVEMTEILWGTFFGIGSFVHTLANPHSFQMLASLHEMRVDDEAIADRLVRFISAGMRSLGGRTAASGDAS